MKKVSLYGDEYEPDINWPVVPMEPLAPYVGTRVSTVRQIARRLFNIYRPDRSRPQKIRRNERLWKVLGISDSAESIDETMLCRAIVPLVRDIELDTPRPDDCDLIGIIENLKGSHDQRVEQSLTIILGRFDNLGKIPETTRRNLVRMQSLLLTAQHILVQEAASRAKFQPAVLSRYVDLAQRLHTLEAITNRILYLMQGFSDCWLFWNRDEESPMLPRLVDAYFELVTLPGTKALCGSNGAINPAVPEPKAAETPEVKGFEVFLFLIVMVGISALLAWYFF